MRRCEQKLNRRAIPFKHLPRQKGMKCRSLPGRQFRFNTRQLIAACGRSPWRLLLAFLACHDATRGILINPLRRPDKTSGSQAPIQKSVDHVSTAYLTDLSETPPTKFSKKCLILRFGSEPNGRHGANKRHATLLFRIIQCGSGCRGWFCCRSVVLVFAGFRFWRFVRARNATRVGGRGRRESLRAVRPALNARR